MFQNSTNIDKRLIREVDQIENIPGHQVISARFFWTPILRFEVECEVLKPRKISLLEEFVLRAAVEFKETPISGEELSDLLGVDNRFIQRTVDDLASMARALDRSTDYLLATEVGEEFYTKGQVPQPPQPITVKLACALPLTDLIAITTKQQRKKSREIPDDAIRLPGIDEVDDGIISEVLAGGDEKAVIDATSRAGHPIHAPDEGITLQRVVTANFQGEDRGYWGVFVVRDVLDNTIFVQVRNWNVPGVNTSQIRQLEDWLNSCLDEDRVGLAELMLIEESSLDDLLQPSDPVPMSDEENRAPVVEKLVQSEILEIRTKPSEEIVSRETNQGGTAELVRDSDIRPSFITALEQAKKRVLIVSPWMTEQAVDDKLIDLLSELAERRVLTSLGWGIAKQETYEDRPPSHALLNKLAAVTTPEGLPAVSVIWLGNQHSKDVVIDDAMHLCGSHNWLSYRGDYKPRGESVYRVTIPEQVENAAKIIEKLFAQKLGQLWNETIALPIDQVQDGALLEIISAWISIGAIDLSIQKSVEVAHKLNRLTPVSVLISSVSERLYGANPETRMKLLQSLIDLWEDQAVRSRHIGSSGFSDLQSNLEGLVRRLAAQDCDQLHHTIETSIDLWREIQIAQIDDTVDSLVQRLTETAQITSTSKPKKQSKSKRKKRR